MKFPHTDYHVHTNWSFDISKNGPSFYDYLDVCEEHQINICFLEHYELYYVETNKYHPFYGEKIVDYIEEIDNIKESYDFVLSGLEVDYYIDRENQLIEFLDNYGDQLDFIAGSVHELMYDYPITVPSGAEKLLSIWSAEKIVDEYFYALNKMVSSNLFRNLCHIDIVFRYINPHFCNYLIDEQAIFNELVEIGKICEQKGVSIECNLSGLRHLIGRPYPSNKVISEYIKQGIRVYVGSDSHSVNNFRKNIPLVKETYENIEKLNSID